MLMVAQIVVSVGPYALTIRRPSDQRATRSGGQASPPTIRVRELLKPLGRHARENRRRE